MFHNSTTIWQKPQSGKMFAENRLAYGQKWEAVKSSFRSSTVGIRKVGRAVSFITSPLRAPFKLAWGGIKMASGGINKGVDGVEWGGRWGKEVALGAGKNALGGSLWSLAKAPLMFLKHNLIDNTRDVFKDVFTLKTVRNILKSPKFAWEGFKDGINETRGHIKEAISLNPFKIINGTRKAIWSTIKTPFKTIYRPTRAVLDTPVQMGKNIGKSAWSYPKHLYESHKPIVTGFNRIKNAHHTATAEMIEEDRKHLRDIPGFTKTKWNSWKEERAKLKAERAAADAARLQGAPVPSAAPA